MDCLTTFKTLSEYNKNIHNLVYPNISRIKEFNETEKNGIIYREFQYMGDPDYEGLTYLQWTSKDINFYRQHTVSWDDNSYKELVNEYDKNLVPMSYDKLSQSTNMINCPMFDMLSVESNNAEKMFENFSYLKSVPEFNTKLIENMKMMFKNCNNLISIPNFNTERVIDMEQMFYNCSKLKFVSKLNTYNVNSMKEMFYGCSSLEKIDYLNTSNVKILENLFGNCTSLLYVPELNTKNAENIKYLFYNCSSLNYIPNFNTYKIKEFNYVFSGCESLKEIPYIDTSAGENFTGMLKNCRQITKIPYFDTSNALNMEEFFNNCSELVYIPLLDTSYVLNFTNAFTNCSKLTYVDGFKDLKCGLDLSSCQQLTSKSITNIIINASSPDQSCDNHLIFGKKNLDKISQDVKNIAIEKGWILQ